MNLNTSLSVILLLFLSLSLQAQQGVKISPQPIPTEPGAILQIQSSTQGILIPRTTQDSILFPVNGLMIFDTLDDHFKYFKDTTWVTLLESSSFYLSYGDHDGDSYGDPYSAIYAPFTPPGYVFLLDCDDFNASVAPGLPELCDGLDNDCDPLTADGINELTLGQPCDGDDIDLCAEGVIECFNGVLGCSDTTGDSAEICDGEDNDCDGLVDEECPIAGIDFVILQFPPSIISTPGAVGPIYGQVYSNGVTESFGPVSAITAQVGYGSDNSDPALGGWTWFSAAFNADIGNNDEYQAIMNIPTPGLYDFAYRFSGDYGITWTYADLNGSQDGYQIIQSGYLNVLEDPCNGTDDDNDGMIDESCPDLGMPCDGDDADLCTDGTVVCLPNGECGCNDDATSIPEICDGFDNDCDGMVDEGCVPLSIDFAILQFPASIYMLSGNTPQLFGQVYSLGITEGLGQGAGISAAVGFGPDGSDPATGGWTWVSAMYNADIGNSDEYVAMLNVPVIGVFDYAYRFSGDFGISWVYADLNGTTDGYQISNAGDMTVVDDLCNGIDDDGDTFIDENCPDLGQPCDGTDTDLCADGFIVCLPNGDCGCSDDPVSYAEICNGLDDDCNGFIDDNCPIVTIQFGNLQFPADITMPAGQTPAIFGQVYAAGITDMVGQGPGILAEVGYGADGSDPSIGGWTWVSATYNTDIMMNNDEYQGVLNVPFPGIYDYAFRYSGDGGITWLYGDLGAGSSDGYNPADAGHLTVN